MRRIPWIPLLLLGLAVGALPAGYLLWSRPDGSALRVQTLWLTGSPFRDYFWPGLMLFCLFGIGSLVTAWAWLRWPRAGAKLVLAEGLGLMAWIIGELFWMPPAPLLKAGSFIVGAVLAVAGWRKVA
jgi:hypothetical protein